MITKEVLSLKNIVRKLLINNIYTRDNDITLFNAVWRMQHKALSEESYNFFITALSNNLLFAPESIRRVRQRTQELYPETRGYMYFKRKGMQEEMKQILIEYDNIKENIQKERQLFDK